MVFDEVAKKFIDSRRARGLAESSIASIRVALGRFSDFVGRRMPSACDLHDYAESRVTGRHGRACAPSTANKELRWVRACLRWAEARGMYDGTAAAASDAFLREERRLPRVLPRDVVDRLVEVASSEPRKAALPVLSFFCALRMGEALHARGIDVSQDAASFHVRIRDGWTTKARAERIVPVPLRARPILARLARRAGRSHLVGLGESPVPRSTAYAWFKAWSREVGTPVTPHDLRRTCLSLMAEAGAAPTSLMAFAGHASVQTTMRHYVMARASGLEGLL